MLKQKYGIGLKFIHYATKVNHTIVDVYKTYNSKNELVEWHYISSHKYNTQTITGEISQSTIERSEICY